MDKKYIQAVRITISGHYQQHRLDRTVFEDKSRWFDSPVADQFDRPMKLGKTTDDDADRNPHATRFFYNLNPWSTFFGHPGGPLRGDVIVVRRDGKPLHYEQVMHIAEYVEREIKRAGDNLVKCCNNWELAEKIRKYTLEVFSRQRAAEDWEKLRNWQISEGNTTFATIDNIFAA